MHSDFDAVEINRISSDDGVPPKEPDPVRLDRHRGLWSFLTRTFFLGQLLAAQQMLSGSAHASQAEDAAAQRNEGSSEDAANPLPARESVSILADNGVTSEQLPGTGLTGQSQSNANPVSADLGQPSSVEAATSLMQASAGSGGGGAGSSAVISSSALARSPHEASGVHSPTIIPGEGGSTPIIQLPIPVVDPDIDVGIDLPGISVQIGVGSGGVSAGIDVPGVIEAAVALPISTAEVLLPVIDVAVLGVDLTGDSGGVSAGIDVPGVVEAAVVLPINSGEVLLPVIDVAALGVDLTGDSGDISADALSTPGTVSELTAAATALSPAPPNLVEEIVFDTLQPGASAVAENSSILTSAFAYGETSSTEDPPGPTAAGVTQVIDAPDAVEDEALPGFSPSIDSLQSVSSSETTVELDDEAAPAQTSFEQVNEPLSNETGAVRAETLDSTVEGSTAGENTLSVLGGDLTGDAPDAVVDEALPGFSPSSDSPQTVSSSEIAVEPDTVAPPVQTSLEQAIEPLGNETGAVPIVQGETLESAAEDFTAGDNTLSVPGLQPPPSSLTADVVSPGVIALADTGESYPSDMLFETYSDLNIELQMEPEPFEPLQPVDTGADDLLPQLDAHDTSDTVQILPDLGRSPFADLFG